MLQLPLKGRSVRFGGVEARGLSVLHPASQLRRWGAAIEHQGRDAELIRQRPERCAGAARQEGCVTDDGLSPAQSRACALNETIVGLGIVASRVETGAGSRTAALEFRKPRQPLALQIGAQMNGRQFTRKLASDPGLARTGEAVHQQQ